MKGKLVGELLPGQRQRLGLLPGLGALLAKLLLASAVCAQLPNPAPPGMPSTAEVAEMLRNEPLARASWPAWRERLLAWIEDRGHGTDAAFQAAWGFLK